MAAKILVVDDEVNMLRLLRFTLEADGYQVITAQDGLQALQRVARDKPDLVILDVMLPEVSGLDVCRRLRGHAATVNLPIIMLSALTNIDDKVSGLEAGADEYVTKPVDPAEISARVRALLARTARLQATQPLKRGGVLAFIGAKGGVGTTTVAANVAIALATKKKSVMALDLQPFVGTLALQLGLQPKEGLWSLPGAADGGPGAETIARHLVRHPSGLRLLAAPQSLAQRVELSAEFVGQLLQQAATLAHWLVLDLPSQPTEANRRAIGMSQAVVLVTEPVANCLQPGRAMVDWVGQSIKGETEVGVVMVNRMGYTMAMTKRQVEEALGAPVLAAIPMASETLFAAQQTGSPVVVTHPESMAARALMELAERLTRSAP